MNKTMKTFLVLGLACNISFATAAGVLGVDALMQAPQKYKGKIKVEGAVTKVLPEKKMIVLIDRKEWEECGEESESCAKYRLPVQFSGSFPNVKDEVVFDGEIKKSDGRYLFVATNIKKYPTRKEAKGKE